MPSFKFQRRLPGWGPGFGGLLLSIVGMSGCGHDTTGPTRVDAAKLLWQVRLNYHAVTLLNGAPYDTVQLIPALQTVTGGAVPGNAVVAYHATDPTSVVVSPMGLVTARAATSQVFVVATATVGNVTALDTVVIAVNDTAVVGRTPVLPTRLVLQGIQNPFAAFGINAPAPPGEGLTEDCERAAGGSVMRQVQIVPQVLAGDAPIPNAVIDLRSADPGIATITNMFGLDGMIAGQCENGRYGPVSILGTARIYGVALQNSIRVNVIPSLSDLFTVLQHIPRATGQVTTYFEPATVTIAAGGVVNWYVVTRNLLRPESIDIVFDDPSGPVLGVDTTGLSSFYQFLFRFPYDTAGGNIAPFADPDTTPDPTQIRRGIDRARRFPVPGTYHFHSALRGATGTIIVQPWTPQ